MEPIWTQDSPKVAGTYWKRETGYPNCTPVVVTITETDLDSSYGKLAMHRTPQERRENTLAMLRQHNTAEVALKFIEGLSEEHWQIWWCGPLIYPAF